LNLDQKRTAPTAYSQVYPVIILVYALVFVVMQLNIYNYIGYKKEKET
jgi:hypothetical protein